MQIVFRKMRGWAFSGRKLEIIDTRRWADTFQLPGTVFIYYWKYTVSLTSGLTSLSLSFHSDNISESEQSQMFYIHYLYFLPFVANFSVFFLFTTFVLETWNTKCEKRLFSKNVLVDLAEMFSITWD